MGVAWSSGTASSNVLLIRGEASTEPPSEPGLYLIVLQRDRGREVSCASVSRRPPSDPSFETGLSARVAGWPTVFGVGRVGLVPPHRAAPIRVLWGPKLLCALTRAPGEDPPAVVSPLTTEPLCAGGDANL